MNPTRTSLLGLGVAAVVAAGLGLYAWFGVLRAERPEASRSQAPDTLFVTGGPAADTDAGPLPATLVTGLTVTLPVSTTVMERHEGVWRITSPFTALADKAQVDALIQELTTLQFKTTFEETPTDADLERYGLKSPQASVAVRAYVPDARGGGAEDPSRQRPLSFSLGTHNAFDDSVYVRREGDPRVHVAPGSLRYVLMKPADGWRDRHLFPLEEASLLRIDVKSRDNVLTLERATTDKPWQLTRPVRMTADPGQVSRMVSGLRERLARSYPDAQREASLRQALEKPLLEATFVPKFGGSTHARFVKVKHEGLEQVFALVTSEARSELAQVDAAALTDLDVPAREFRDKRVLALSLADVQRIVVHPAPGGEGLLLERAPDTSVWEVVQPMHGVAKAAQVASLLNGLDQLRALGITEIQPRDWKRYGITDTSRSVTLLDGSGQVMARLWVGGEVKNNSSRVWARGSGEDVFELDKTAYEALPLKLEDFMDISPGPSGPR